MSGWKKDRKANIYEMYAELGERLFQDYPDVDWQNGFDTKFWYESVVPIIEQINKKYRMTPINTKEEEE